MNWKIELLDNNKYRLSLDDKFIEFEVLSKFNDMKIDILSKNMSDDNIIFMSELYPTEDNDNVIIGIAYLYENKKCIDNDLVELHVLSTNITYHKRILEMYWQ